MVEADGRGRFEPSMASVGSDTDPAMGSNPDVSWAGSDPDMRATRSGNP